MLMTEPRTLRLMKKIAPVPETLGDRLAFLNHDYIRSGMNRKKLA